MVVQPMMWRTTAVLSSATVVATWLAAGPTQTSEPSATSSAVRADAAVREDQPTEVAVEAERLRVRLPIPSSYAPSDRDPFSFERVQARDASPAVAIPAGNATAAVGDADTTALGMSLAGIAEDRTDAGVVRTAVVNLFGDVILVREGDSIGDGYRVIRIAADSVALRRERDAATVRLEFRP